MDDFCDTRNTLDAGTSQRLHDGWIYSYIACHRNRCGLDQGHSGAKTSVSGLQVPTCDGLTLQ